MGQMQCEKKRKLSVLASCVIHACHGGQVDLPKHICFEGGGSMCTTGSCTRAHHVHNLGQSNPSCFTLQPTQKQTGLQPAPSQAPRIFFRPHPKHFRTQILEILEKFSQNYRKAIFNRKKITKTEFSKLSKKLWASLFTENFHIKHKFSKKHMFKHVEKLIDVSHKTQILEILEKCYVAKIARCLAQNTNSRNSRKSFVKHSFFN